MAINRTSITAIIPVLVLAGAWLAWQHIPAPMPQSWSDQELQLLRSLSLDKLPDLPPDPGNAVADDPDAAALGHRLFFDPRLSSNELVSCATCHQPEHHFTDQRPVAVALGTADRNSMGLVGVAYTPWLFWDGRKDSLWAQALEPLENPLEHGLDRRQVVDIISTDPTYQSMYQRVFGRSPQPAPDKNAINLVFANVGKALAAYQRLLLPAPSPFDHYVDSVEDDARIEANEYLDSTELAGLRLFISKAQCVNCHNGPLFTNNSFHNTAVLPAPGVLPALGRAAGLRLALDDPFNCLGPFSDAAETECQELRFARGGDEMIGAQRTASLRNLGKTAPYMHAGQIATLAEVIEHYNEAGLSVVGHNEAKPLRLRAIEKAQLEAFLHTLNGPLATDPQWLQPPPAKTP